MRKVTAVHWWYILFLYSTGLGVIALGVHLWEPTAAYRPHLWEWYVPALALSLISWLKVTSLLKGKT